jgi:hypothetical protein
MTNPTIDANGTAHNGKGVRGAGQFAVGQKLEPSLVSGLGSVPAVPERSVPTGEAWNAIAAKTHRDKTAEAYAKALFEKNPEFLIALAAAAQNVVENGTAVYPEAQIVVHSDPEEESYFAELKCPWCGHQGMTEAFHEVGVAETWEDITIDDTGETVSIDNDADSEFDANHIKCASCANPVSLPDTIEVQYR